MGGMMNGGFNYLDNYWLMGGFIGLLINVAIIVSVVLLVVWAVQKFSHSTNQPASTNSSTAGQTLSAREILDIRYARGELTREEYQTMLGDIA